MSLPRILEAVAATRAAAPVRSLVNRAVGRRLRVVRVRGGVGRGLRLELDLTREKAYWLGHYEPAVQDALRAHVSAGAVVYDIGAHLGFVTLCAAALGARVYAFEPFPDSAERLRRNVELNAGLDVQVVEAAVWDESGEIELDALARADDVVVASGRNVPAVALDAFARSHGAPDLLKIDVEGAEGRVLRGAGRLLRQARPTIICEVHGPEAEAEVAGLLHRYDVEPLGSRWRILARPRD